MSEATERVISGLEGVLACESSIAYIDGSIPELSFRGYDIHDIAQTLTFEQVDFPDLARSCSPCRGAAHVQRRPGQPAGYPQTDY